MAATSENRATNRLCSRAPARAARRAARRRANSIEMRTMRMTTTRPSPTINVRTTVAVGMIGVKPAKTRNVARARTKAAPTTTIPKRPVGGLSSRSGEPRALIVVVPVKFNEPKAPKPLSPWRASLAPSWQTGNDVAEVRLRKGLAASMKRFVEGEDRTQGVLLPEFLDDYVAEDNPVRVDRRLRR